MPRATCPPSVPAGFHRLRWEERQLWRLARRDVPAFAVEAALVDPGGSPDAWRAVIALGARVSVLPLLARAYLTHPALAAVVPDDGAAALRLAEWSARARRASYGHSLTPVIAAWAEAEISPVLLKGIALAHTLYPIGARWLHDADIWVPPDSFARAEHTLRDAGFVRFQRPGLSADAARRAFHGQMYVRSGANGQVPLVIDLHDSLFMPGSRFSLDVATAPTATLVLPDGHSVQVLRREEQFVHLATQIVSDGRLPLQRLADLVALRTADIAGDAPIDTTRLFSIASRAGATDATTLAWRWAGIDEPLDAPANRDAQSTAPSAAGIVIGHPLGWLPDRELPAPIGRLVTMAAVRRGAPRATALLSAVRNIWARRRHPMDVRTILLALRLPVLLLAGSGVLAGLRALAVFGEGAQEPLAGRCWRRRALEAPERG